MKASNVLGQVAYLGCLGGAESLCHRLGVLILPRWGVDCRADLVWILRRGAGGEACGAVSAAADASPGVGVSTQFPPNVIGPGGGLGATYLVQRHPPLP